MDLGLSADPRSIGIKNATIVARENTEDGQPSYAMIIDVDQHGRPIERQCDAGPRARPSFEWCKPWSPLPLPDLEELSDALGITGSCLPVDLDPQRHVDFILNNAFPLLPEGPAATDALLSRFCVSHLPKLVDAFLDPPFIDDEDEYVHPNQLWNAYTWMLIRLSRNAYFVKYMMSKGSYAARASEIIPAYVDALVDDLYNFESVLKSERDFGRFVHIFEFLLTLLELRRDKPECSKLTIRVLAPLFAFLDAWAPERCDELCGDVFTRISFILKSSPSFVEAASRERERLQGLETCARPGCDSTSDLYICARCRTVLYCGREHQRDHWLDANAPHKSVCFETAF